jgi:hypothetical protein
LFFSSVPKLGNKESSFFCLESDRYGLQILALDTGYNSVSVNIVDPEKPDYTTFLGDKEAKWAQAR